MVYKKVCAGNNSLIFNWPFFVIEHHVLVLMSVSDNIFETMCRVVPNDENKID